MSDLAPCRRPGCGCSDSYPDVVEMQPCRKCRKCHHVIPGSVGASLVRQTLARLRADREAQAVRRQAGILDAEGEELVPDLVCAEDE